MITKSISRNSIATAVVITIGLILNTLQAWENSPTADESVHLAAGVTYLQTGNFDYNTPHPPLVKLLAGLLVAPQANTAVRFSDDAEKKFSDLNAANDMLYRDPDAFHHARWLTFLGRLPMMLFWLALVVVTTLWASRRWGAVAGLIAAGVLVFDPNLVGHGNLMNTDIPLAAGIITTIWAFDRYLTLQTKKWLAIFVIIFALTQLTKYSAIILWPIILGLSVIKVFYDRKVFSWKKWLIMTGALIIGTGFIIWATYGFQFTRVDISSSWNRPTHYLKKYVNIPWPAGNYFQGLYEVMKHNKFGHQAFLLGETETKGWWYYFPVAFGVKTPIITLALFTAWAVMGLAPSFRKEGLGWFAKRPPFNVFFFGLPPIVFFLASMNSNLNLGVRHIFPIWPFMALAIASLVTVTTKRWWKPALVTSVLGLAVTLGLAWPDTIAYFNSFVGGTSRGYRVLQNSNLDWGQDAWRLRTFIDEQHFDRYAIELFGSVPEQKVFPDRQRLLVTNDIVAGAKPTGVIFVSSAVLHKSNSNVSWLQAYQPTWQIGSTIAGYDFRSPRPTPESLQRGVDKEKTHVTMSGL